MLRLYTVYHTAFDYIFKLNRYRNLNLKCMYEWSKFILMLKNIESVTLKSIMYPISNSAETLPSDKPFVQFKITLKYTYIIDLI